MLPWFVVVKLVALGLGAVSNLLLLAAVRKHTPPAVRDYGHMVMASALMDLFYVVVCVVCLHVSLSGNFVKLSCFTLKAPHSAESTKKGTAGFQEPQTVDHALLIMVYGPEFWLRDHWWLQNIVSGLEYYALVFAVLILPAQFYYRYYLISTDE